MTVVGGDGIDVPKGGGARFFGAGGGAGAVDLGRARRRPLRGDGGTGRREPLDDDDDDDDDADPKKQAGGSGRFLLGSFVCWVGLGWVDRQSN